MKRNKRSFLLMLSAVLTGTFICVFASAALSSCYFPDREIDEKSTGQALFIMDMQKDFTEETGRLPVDMAQAEGVLANINDLILSSGKQRMDVIYIRNEFPRRAFLANRFRNFAAVEGEEGSDFDDRLILSGGPVFTKKKPDAFSSEMLKNYLKANGIGVIYITGVYADQCVLRTALRAVKNGYRVICLEDSVAGKNGERVTRAVRKMERAGISIMTTEEILN